MRDPHPTSPWKGEEQIAFILDNFGNHRPDSSPYQGEAGWGYP